MNLLIDLVPKTITIDNKEYEINSDFRTSILFELLMQDKSIKDNDKIYLALELYYPNIPDDIKERFKEHLSKETRGALYLNSSISKHYCVVYNNCLALISVADSDD